MCARDSASVCVCDWYQMLVCHCASTYAGWLCPLGRSMCLAEGDSLAWPACRGATCSLRWDPQLGGGGRSRGWPDLRREGWWAKRKSHAPVTRGSQPQPSPTCPQMWTSAVCSLTCVPMVSASTALAPSDATARPGTRQMPQPQPAWVSPSFPTPNPAQLLHTVPGLCFCEMTKT